MQESLEPVTIGQIKEFEAKSPIWAVIKYVIKGRLHSCEGALRELRGEDLYNAQGAAKELDWMVKLPIHLIRAIEEKEQRDATRAERADRADRAE